MTLIDIQLSPGHTDWPRLRDAVLEAEARGFRAAWVFDHLAGGVLGGGRTMLECCTLLGGLAATTTTIELGTMVANVWNRQPGTLLVAAASVVEMSGGRPMHLGLGAGTSPSSGFAAEQHATDAEISPDLAVRQQRVADTIRLARRMWADDRAEEFETFALPRPQPSLIVGVNSVSLCRIAGELADGVNVAWGHPRRDEFLDAASAVAEERPFQRTVYTMYDEALLDPGHPERLAMTERGIDRLILAELGPLPF